jgi:hypothetical protein
MGGIILKSMVEDFIKEVVNHIVAEDRIKERISKDLYLHIQEASQQEDINTVLRKMGTPEAVAKEFMDTIYEDKSEVIEKLIEEKVKNDSLKNEYYEYKSKITILDLPLVHIKFRRRYMGMGFGRPALAKGIIAMGDMAIGVISVGGVAIGGLSFGGVCLGAVAFGGAAIGGLAMGGFALGVLAIGGFAAGLYSIGGFALGDIAFGGFAKGNVAIQNDGFTSKEEAYRMIKTVYPDISDRIIKIFTFFIK